jgi:anti-sigma factor RsiW
MTCDDARAQLDTYLDGELSAEQMLALDAHLKSCPACAAEVLVRVQAKRAVKSAGLRYQPGAALRAKIQTQVAARPHRSWKFGWRTTPAVFAAALLAGVVTMYVGRQELRRQQLYSEITDLHVAALGSANPVDVVSSDRHTVKPWFQGKIPFTFNLPELQGSDFTLLGGRVTYLEQTPGAHLIFQIRKHEISVFLFPENAADHALGDNARAERRNTFNVETWTQAGLRYVVLGDVGAEDIEKLSALLRSAEG